MLGRWFKSLESDKAPRVWGLIFVLSQSLLLLILRPLGIGNFLRLQTAFSKDFYVHTFELWKEKSVFFLYPVHLYVDLLHPAAYACFLGSLLVRRCKPLFFLPFAAAIFDFLENALQFYFLSQTDWAALPSFLIALSGCASIAKWTLAGISIGAILFPLGRLEAHPR